MEKLDKLIKIISALLLSLLIGLGINDIYSQKKLFSEYISHLEKDIKMEYKNRLKDMVNTTISFIRSTHRDIEKNYYSLLLSEANYLNKLFLMKDKKFNDNFIKNYDHDFLILTKEISTNRITKRMIINNEVFFLSVKNDKISKILENKTRNFLYENITVDNRYLWVNKIINYEGGDNYAQRLIHPSLKATEGIFLSTKDKDIHGNLPYLTELNGINKNREIFFEYYFKTMSTNIISKKLSYARLYINENWIIATGIPLTTLNEEIINRSKIIKEKFHDYIIRLIIIGFLVVLLYILLLRKMNKKINQYFHSNNILRKKLRTQLKISEKKVNKYFNLSVNLNLISGFDGKIYEINDEITKILGYDKNEILNSSFLDIVHPQDLNETLKEMEKLNNGEVVLYFINRYRHKNGTYRYLAWSANADDKKEFIYASAQDITDAKTKDTLYNQQSKMAAMGEMIANIAHQWKQPLSVITTISSSIELKYENGILDEKDIPSSMQSIENSANYLAHTIDDFRNFFKQNKEKNITTVSKIIEKTLKLTSTQYKRNEIEIIQNIDDIELLVLENELIQVMINFLSNSKDAFNSDNTKKLIFINASKTKENITIEVKDNAGGISDDVISKIFDPYFTTKEEDKGTGIGLYMSNEIVVNHLSGQIIVTNDFYEYEGIEYLGAKFQIILPNLTK